MADEWWADAEDRFGPAKPVQLSPKGRDYAIRTLLAEAGDQGDLGQAAVAHVMSNRVKHGGFGEGFEGVITKPYAFEPWLHAGTGRQNDPMRFDPKSSAYQRAGQIFDAVVAGQIPDPTRGATHFYSPTGQAQLASIDNRKLVPDWATSGAYRASIGGHQFFAPEGGGAGKRIINISREAPQEAAAYQAPDYIRGAEEAAGGHLISPEFMPSPVAPIKPIEVALPGGAPQQSWGPVSSFLTGAASGLTGGAGSLPEATATARAGLEYLTGRAPQGFVPRQRELAQQYQQAREAYQAEAPTTHMLSEQLGGVAGTLAPMAALGRGAGLAARTVGELAPVAKPALEAATRFVTGRAGMGGTGLGGGATRLASYGAQGGIQGAGQAALMQDLEPEGSTMPSNLLAGGALGAGMGMAINPMLSKFAAPLTAPITENLRNMAIRANEKFGLGIRPTQITRDEGLQALDKRIVATHLNEKQVEKFNEELANQVGMRGKKLTRDEVAAAKSEFGQKLDDIAATTSMKPERDFYKSLGDIRAEVYGTTLDGNPLRGKIDQLLMHIYNEVSPTGFMDGRKFRAITKRNGTIDKQFYKDDPALAHDIRDLMYDMFQVSDAAKASAYNMARENYKKLNAIEPLTGASGYVNPKAVMKRVKRAKLTGDIRELAEAGEYLPDVTPRGGVKETTGKEKPSWWQYGLGAGGVATGLHEGAPLVGQVLDYLNISPASLIIPSTVLGGAHYVGTKLSEKAMQSPLINNLVLRGKIPDVVTPAGNILERGAGQLGAQVGAGKGK